METYYTDQNGTIFRAYKDFLERCVFEEFNTEHKEWKYAEWKDENQRQNNQITEITKAQAMQRLQACILDGLDRKELRKYIDLLCRNRKTEWHPMEKQPNGVYVMGYPRYPKELFDIFGLLGPVRDYRMEMENWPENLLPTDMDAWQIRTALTYLQRAERFCTGTIAEAVDDGTLLKLLLRLEDLLDAHQGKARHW